MSSELAVSSAPSSAPRASSSPLLSMTETFLDRMPGTAEATRCWMARDLALVAGCLAGASTTEAVGSARSRENSSRFGITRWTRAERDLVDRADGARQLAFEGADLVDLLHEVGGAERVGAVEDLVADRAARGDAFGGEGETQPRHLVLRHVDLRAVAAQLVGDALGIHALDDLAAVAGVEAAVEQRHARRREAGDDEDEEGNQGKADGCQCHEAGRPQVAQRLHQSIHERHRCSNMWPIRRSAIARVRLKFSANHLHLRAVPPDDGPTIGFRT